MNGVESIIKMHYNRKKGYDVNTLFIAEAIIKMKKRNFTAMQIATAISKLGDPPDIVEDPFAIRFYTKATKSEKLFAVGIDGNAIRYIINPMNEMDDLLGLLISRHSICNVLR